MRTLPLGLALLLMAPAVSAQEVSLSHAAAKVAYQHYETGVRLMMAEKCEEAVEAFRSALDIDKQMAIAHYNIGNCRMMQKRYADAVMAFIASRQAFEQIGLLSQTDKAERERLRRDEINDLKHELRKAQNNTMYPDALTRTRMEDRVRQLEFMQYREREGETSVPAGIFLALGSAYFHQGKLEDAEREYVEAVRLDRKLGAAHNNLAVVYLMTGRPDEAQASIELAERNGFRVNPAFKEDLKKATEAVKQSSVAF
jgi:tetratricopeptide (TPR) repeat protein